MFLSDLIQALQSEDFERFSQAVEQAEHLVRKNNLNDLELMASDLLDVLFRCENKFELESFLQLKYGAIQAVCELTHIGV